MEALSYAFEWNSSVVDGLFSKIEENNFEKRFNNSNSIHWIIGHLAASRRMICGLVGVSVDEVEWKKYFDIGSSPDLPEDCPAPIGLRDDFQSIGTEMCTAIKSMSADDLNKPIKSIISDEKVPLVNNLQFLYYPQPALIWFES